MLDLGEAGGGRTTRHRREAGGDLSAEDRVAGGVEEECAAKSIYWRVIDPKGLS
jgi:hypothetical protein